MQSVIECKDINELIKRCWSYRGQGPGKGEYCWAKFKMEDGGSKTFDNFITDNDESKYPNGDVLDGFYYERCFTDDQTVYMLKISDTESVYAQLAGDETVVLTATPNDIRLGTTAVTEKGVVEGEKDIPSYHTKQSVRAIRANDMFILPFYDNQYDYTKLQAMTAPYNTSLSDSVAVDRVVIDDSVYNAGSTEMISTVTKDDENKAINFGIMNGDLPYVIRYFTYREEI